LTNVDTNKLLATWEVQSQRAMWRRVLARAEAEGRTHGVTAARSAMAELSSVRPLEALRANAELVQLLVARRWSVMQEAREHGASWTEVGDALGVSRQAAWEFYQRAIEGQESDAIAWHDPGRARAMLGEPYALWYTPGGWRLRVAGWQQPDGSDEWTVAPADTDLETAQLWSDRLLRDLKRGVICDWITTNRGGDVVYLAQLQSSNP
jgi:hypothetical protein